MKAPRKWRYPQSQLIPQSTRSIEAFSTLVLNFFTKSGLVVVLLKEKSELTCCRRSGNASESWRERLREPVVLDQRKRILVLSKIVG